jgi:endonuclease/exonuclease/phosphatase family metal-dependent hydrolase
MIRHIAMFTWADDTTDEQVASIAGALEALPAIIPEIVRYTVGANLALTEGNADFVVVGDFASEEDYRTYASHPAHVAVSNDHIKPVLGTMKRIQIVIAD